jgi:alkylmercury lyase
MLSEHADAVAVTIRREHATDDTRRAARRARDLPPACERPAGRRRGRRGPREVDAERAEELLSSWPGVFRDRQRRIIGFWGLTIHDFGPHRLRVDRVELSAWCAWDTLFLPEVLARPADVRSRSPQDHEPISLRVSPHRIEASSPEAIVRSMVPARQSDDFIRSFCHHIHFFASAVEGERWIADRTGAFLMELAAAFELGRHVNRERYGDVLASSA